MTARRIARTRRKQREASARQLSERLPGMSIVQLDRLARVAEDVAGERLRSASTRERRLGDVLQAIAESPGEPEAVTVGDIADLQEALAKWDGRAMAAATRAMADAWGLGAGARSALIDNRPVAIAFRDAEPPDGEADPDRDAEPWDALRAVATRRAVQALADIADASIAQPSKASPGGSLLGIVAEAWEAAQAEQPEAPTAPTVALSVARDPADRLSTGHVAIFGLRAGVHRDWEQRYLEGLAPGADAIPGGILSAIGAAAVTAGSGGPPPIETRVAFELLASIPLAGRRSGYRGRVRWTLDTTVEAIRRRLFPEYRLAESGAVEERTVNAHRDRRHVRAALAWLSPAHLAAAERFAITMADGEAWRPVAFAEVPVSADRGSHVTAHLQVPADAGFGPRYHAATAAALGRGALAWRLYLSLCLAWYEGRGRQKRNPRPAVTLDAADVRAICFGLQSPDRIRTGREQARRALAALRTLAAAGIADVSGPEAGPWEIRAAREDRAHPDLAGTRLPDLSIR